MKLTFHVQGCCCMFCSVQNRPVGSSPDRAFYVQFNRTVCGVKIIEVMVMMMDG